MSEVFSWLISVLFSSVAVVNTYFHRWPTSWVGVIVRKLVFSKDKIFKFNGTVIIIISSSSSKKTKSRENDGNKNVNKSRKTHKNAALMAVVGVDNVVLKAFNKKLQKFLLSLVVFACYSLAMDERKNS